MFGHNVLSAWSRRRVAPIALTPRGVDDGGADDVYASGLDLAVIYP
jgi:hypothetical protein